MKKILFLFSVVTFLAIGCNKSQQQETPSVTTNIPTNTIIGEATLKNNENGYADNSYSYDGVILTYEQNKNDKGYVTVYSTQNGKKQLLIDKAIKDIPGDTYPQFKKTADPNIALLDAETGDSGGYLQEYYFIVISSLKVLKVVNTNGPLISVTDFSKNNSDIELSIPNPCSSDDTGGPATSILKGFKINNKLAFDLPNISLSCLHPGGIGPTSNPDPVITPVGVNSDLSKVYFSLQIYPVLQGIDLSAKEEDYSFNVSTKKIIQEQPKNLLYSTKEPVTF